MKGTGELVFLRLEVVMGTKHGLATEGIEAAWIIHFKS